MKKKILGSIAVIAIAAVAAFNVHVNMNEDNVMSALSLANVEALADGEADMGVTCDGSGSITCPLNQSQVRKVVIWG
ncbi:NVEALA domain-containing protein [Sphingobacterium pedocola]|uniref:NVEALA protein n=1 Tax=Sphingobacterium pedocola TaxID=2082722 RepID=A0ABR9TAD7_9SPHI|nr:NVEALA domain-containing protein [Sphingobacterium pedocola]MBE8722327.1 hypothetical protein [Sphingobacterium pedocola]